MLNQPKHTPGILSIYDDGDSPDCSDILLAHTDDTNWDVCEISTDLPVLVRKANARRLAACWNACQDIPTEALEEGAIAELRAALESLLDVFIHTEGNPKGNKAKTDIIKYNQPHVSDALNQARNVLAKAKQED